MGRFEVFFLSHTASGFQLGFLSTSAYGFSLGFAPEAELEDLGEGQEWRWWNCLGCRSCDSTRYSGELAAKAAGNICSRRV